MQFKFSKFKTTKLGIALITIATLLLTGCGGPQDHPPSASTLNGVAAVGTPIANGTINVSCAAGSTLAPTTTSSTGAWQVTLSGQTLPCAVEVSGGTINGSTNIQTYHSIAIAPGTVNVTPLTDLMVANLAGTATPSTWFAGLSTTPISLTAITQTQVDATLTKLRTALSALTPLSTINPITTAFTPTTGNASDDMLSVLALAMSSSGVTYTTLLSNSSAPGFTSSGAGFNTALTQGYASLARGVIVFEPKDLYVFPESLGTIVNPSIGTVQVGQTYTTTSTSGTNCSYGAIVAKQGSSATATDALTTWNILDPAIGSVMSQPFLTNGSTGISGPMIKIDSYGTTSVSIYSPAMNITGYFNIHAINNPKLFPSQVIVPLNTLSAASITLGPSINEGMDLSPWTFRTDNASVVKSITPAGLGKCGEVTFSSGIPGKAKIFADATGPGGAVTIGPVNVCVDSSAHTSCLPTIAITPSSASVVAGASVQLTAQETDTFGSAVNSSSLVWTSSDPNVSVDANGLVTTSTSASGTATITVTDSNAKVSATSSITIISNTAWCNPNISQCATATVTSVTCAVDPTMLQPDLSGHLPYNYPGAYIRYIVEASGTVTIYPEAFQGSTTGSYSTFQVGYGFTPQDPIWGTYHFFGSYEPSITTITTVIADYLPSYLGQSGGFGTFPAVLGSTTPVTANWKINPVPSGGVGGNGNLTITLPTQITDLEIQIRHVDYTIPDSYLHFPLTCKIL